MRKLVLALLVGLAIAAPETAQASTPSDFAPAGLNPASEMQWEAYATAQRYWGVGDETPGWLPPGCASMELLQAPEVSANGESLAGLTDRVGPSLDGRCWIILIEDQSFASSWIETCLIATHELGHVLGHDHTDDPNNVMFGGEGGDDRFDPPCREARLVTLLAGHRSRKYPRYRARIMEELKRVQEWRPQ